MTTPNPPPNNGDGQYTPGTVPNPFSLGQLQGAGVLPASPLTPQNVGGAIGGLITQGLGIKVNLINIVLNTVFYGAITALGIYVMIRGLFLVVQQVPGASGVGGYLGDTVSSIAGFTIGRFL